MSYDTSRWIHALIISVGSVLPAPALALPESAVGETVFVDRTAELGLKIGGGAACWADIDNDGWSDLVAGGVWKNDKGKKFEKVADVPGVCVAADFDNDGFVDLFSLSALKVLRNVGARHKEGWGFEELKMPELPSCAARGAAWADLNGDGFLDLYVGGYEGGAVSLLLLVNEKGKSFRLDFKGTTGHRTRGVSACDFDQDGDIDIYASNYRLQPNHLWVNDGTGKFQEAAGAHGVLATSGGFGGGHSIGACWGDFDNDGHVDLFAGNFAHRDGRGDQPKSRFLRNLGKDGGWKFEDKGTCGVFYQESYASPAAGDYDNDGNLDLYFTTVYGVASFGRKNNPVLFRSNGKFAVTDATASAKLPKLPPTYQACWCDYDNDGDLDLVTAAKLFQNQGNKNGWLEIRLVGDGKTINRSAVGAQARVKVGEKVLTRQVEAGTGEGNQNDLTLHFGLGKHEGPLTVEVLWPDGRRQTREGALPNRILTVRRE